MDQAKHITAFKISNFRRFKLFEMNDLGQFNLIFGDNNTGKTSVLESLLIYPDPDVTYNSLFYALDLRGKRINMFSELLLYKNIEINNIDRVNVISVDHFYGERLEEIAIVFDARNQKIGFKYPDERGNDRLDERPTNQNYSHGGFFKFPFVPFFHAYDDDLVTFYSNYIQTDRNLKNQLVEDLRVLVPEIENIEPGYKNSKPELIVYQRDVTQTMSMAFLGEGTLKLFRILAEIIINRGGRLMIDEIDTGIHFSRFKTFWETILRSAERNDVQLFMTTHNEECLRYFIDVLRQPKFTSLADDARGISLMQLPDKSIKAYTYPFENLEANVSLGNEVRGGRK